MLTWPKPRASEPVWESGWSDAGELVLGEGVGSL